MATEEISAAFNAVETISDALESIEQSIESTVNAFQNMDAAMASSTASSQAVEKATESLENTMNSMERSIDSATRALENYTRVQGVSVGSAATQAGAMKLAAKRIDEVGDNALKSAGQLTVMDTVMKELSLSSSALSINIGAFNVSLQNLAALVPIFASLGTAVSIFGALTSAVINATAALGAFTAGGAIAFAQDLQEEVAGITNGAEAMEAIMGGLRETFVNALEPLIDRDGSAQFFVDVVEGLAGLVNRFSQAVVQMESVFMPFFNRISDVVSREFDAINTAIMNSSSVLLPILGDLIEWFLTKLPDALNFMAQVTANLQKPLGNLGGSVLDTLTSIVRFTESIIQGLAPALAVALDVVTQVVDLLNVMGNGVLQATLFIGGLGFATMKFIGIANMLANVLVTTVQQMLKFGSTVHMLISGEGDLQKAIEIVNDKILDQFKHLRGLGQIMMGTASIADISGKKFQDMANDIQDMAEVIQNAEGDMEDMRNEFQKLILLMETGNFDQIDEQIDFMEGDIESKSQELQRKIEALSGQAIVTDGGFDPSELPERPDPDMFDQKTGKLDDAYQDYYDSNGKLKESFQDAADSVQGSVDDIEESVPDSPFDIDNPEDDTDGGGLLGPTSKGVQGSTAKKQMEKLEEGSEEVAEAVSESSDVPSLPPAPSALPPAPRRNILENVDELGRSESMPGSLIGPAGGIGADQILKKDEINDALAGIDFDRIDTSDMSAQSVEELQRKLLDADEALEGVETNLHGGKVKDLMEGNVGALGSGALFTETSGVEDYNDQVSKLGTMTLPNYTSSVDDASDSMERMAGLESLFPTEQMDDSVDVIDDVTSPISGENKIRDVGRLKTVRSELLTTASVSEAADIGDDKTGMIEGLRTQFRLGKQEAMEGAAESSTKNIDIIKDKYSSLTDTTDGVGGRISEVSETFRSKAQKMADDAKIVGRKVVDGFSVIGGAAAESLEIGINKIRQFDSVRGALSAGINRLTFSSDLLSGSLRGTAKSALVAAKNFLVTGLNATVAELGMWKATFASQGLAAGLKAVGASAKGAALSLWATVTGALASAASFVSALIPASISAGTALNVAFAGIPLLMAGIVAAGAAVVGVLGNMGKIASGAAGAFKGLKSGLAAIGSAIMKAAVPAWNIFIDIIEAVLSPVFAVIDGIANIGKALGLVSEKGEEGGGILSMLIGLFDAIMSITGSFIDFVAPAFDFIGNIIYAAIIAPFNIVAATIELVIGIVSTLIDWLKQVPIIGDGITTLTQGFGEFISLISGLPSIVSSVTKNIQKFFGNIIDGTLGELFDMMNKAVRLSNETLGTDFKEMEMGDPTGKFSGAKVTAEDVSSNIQSDKKKADDRVNTNVKSEFKFEENTRNSVDVQADPEDKAQISRITKDALREANSFERQQQTGGN